MLRRARHPRLPRRRRGRPRLGADARGGRGGGRSDWRRALVGRYASVLPLARPGDHARPALPRARRGVPRGRPSAGDVRTACPRGRGVGRRGDRGHEPAGRAPADPAGALGQQPVLAGSGDGHALAPDRPARGHPDGRLAPCASRLGRIRRDRRIVHAVGVHQEPEGTLVGRPPEPAVRHGRGADLRHAGRPRLGAGTDGVDTMPGGRARLVAGRVRRRHARPGGWPFARTAGSRGGTGSARDLRIWRRGRQSRFATWRGASSTGLCRRPIRSAARRSLQGSSS